MGCRKRKLCALLVVIFFGLLVGVSEVSAQAAKAPASALEALAAGQAQELIVLYDDTVIEREAAGLRKQAGVAADTAAILERKAAQYAIQKQAVLIALPRSQFDLLQDYSHLPLQFVRFQTQEALTRLLADLNVKAVYVNQQRIPLLASSLPLIKQPQTAAIGRTGSGATIAVLDTGVDYTHPDFGSCPAPGVPGCKVIYAQDFAPDDGFLDDFGHGTNVAAIALGVAPDAKIASLDVFRPDGFGYDSDIIAAINWSIANKSVYHIVAMNMSLGGGGSMLPCPESVFAVPLANARAAGILTAAAAGNEIYPFWISEPACSPAAVSVGAVHDSDVGPFPYVALPPDFSGFTCQDRVSYPDKVACFSSSAWFLTLLAPGVCVDGGGLFCFSGTSMATPHVAGAVAVLRSAFPGETLTQTVARLTSTGVPILDPRNGNVYPRLDLYAAVTGTGKPLNPSVALTLVEDDLLWGQYLVLRARTWPGRQNNLVDGYVKIEGPGVTYYLNPDLFTLSTTPTPVVRSYTVGNFSGTILAYYIPIAWAAGEYRITAFGVIPGSDPSNPTNSISNVSTQILFLATE